jgi:hypothetical protein
MVLSHTLSVDLSNYLPFNLDNLARFDDFIPLYLCFILSCISKPKITIHFLILSDLSGQVIDSCRSQFVTSSH